MPATNLYKLEIELVGGSREGSLPVAGTETSMVTTTRTATAGGKSKARGELAFFVAYRQVKSFASQMIGNEVGKVGLKTASNRLQEKANFAHQVTSTTWNIAEGIGAGALVGGGIGAVVGAVTSIAHTLVTFSNNQSIININKSIENQSINMNYIRAGTQGSRSK